MDFVGLPGARDAVDFEVVDAPFGIEAGDGVIVGLRGLVVLEAVIVGVPLAGVGGVGGFSGAEVGARDAEVVGDGLARDAADDVDAEFKAEGVDPVGEGTEAFAAGGGGEAVEGRHVAAVGGEGVVLMAGGVLGMLGKPALVDDDILPAEALQVVVEPGDGVAELRFVDGETPGIPAVPAHGRSLHLDAHVFARGEASGKFCESYCTGDDDEQ